MPYLSLSAIVAEASRSANAAERLLDLSFQPLPEQAPKKPKDPQLPDAKPADNNAGEASASIPKILESIFGKKGAQ